MGGRLRSKRLVKRLTLDDEDFRESVLENDTNKAILITGLNIFDMCGNCTWRHKCIHDGLTEGLRKFGLMDKDLNTDKLAGVGEFVMGYLNENLEPSQKMELVQGVFDRLDGDPEDLLTITDKLFGDCDVLNRFDTD